MKSKLLFAAICIIALFSVNLTYGHYPVSPYAFCNGNPVNFVDPDGRDYYRSASGAIIWQDDDTRKITINDEVFTNIGKSYSMRTADGRYVNYYQNVAISTSAEAVDAEQAVLGNAALAGAMLSTGSSLAGGSQQQLMTDMVHQMQGEFIVEAVDISSLSLQKTGDALTTAGYVVSTTGMGAEAGLPLVAIGNAMKYTGLGIESVADFMRGNKRKIGYNVFTNGTMYGIGQLGHYAPGPYRAVFNLILTPYNTALSYGAETITPDKQKR